MTSLTGELIEHDIGTNGRLVIRGVEGSIALTAVDGTTVRVEGTGVRPIEDDYRVRRTTDGLELAAIEDRGPFGIGRAFHRIEPITVLVPRGARVWIETASGPIRADGLTGDQHYRSISGDLRIATAGGSIDLETVSGDVELEGVDVLRAAARSVSGDLAVRAPTIATLQLRTTSGAIRVAGAFVDSGTHAVETVSGDVTLLPVGPVRVQGSTVSGDVESSLAHRSGGKPGRRTIELGEGGPVISFRSISGDIRVEAGAPALVAPATTDRHVAPAEAAEHRTAEAEAGDQAVDSERLRILRELEAAEIDIAEAERRLADLEPIEPAHRPAAGSGGAGDAGLGWVRRV